MVLRFSFVFQCILMLNTFDQKIEDKSYKKCSFWYLQILFTHEYKNIHTSSRG